MADNVRKLSFRNSAEQNKKVLTSAMHSTENFKSLRESIKGSIGLDINDKAAFPVHSPSFSLKEMKKKAMREAVTGSSWPQLLRAGVQVAFNNLIEQYTGTTYNEWAHVIPSDKFTELYAPLHGISFLTERGPGQKFSEAQVAGLDLALNNREFGEILAIEQNLIEDDQTGQLQQLVGQLAEWTELLKEVYCLGKLNAIGGSYGGLSVPVSETYTTAYASSAAPFTGGGYNRPLAYGALNQANIQAGVESLMVQKNLLGLIMNVKAQGLLISPLKKFDAMVLMQSTNNPSVPSNSPGDNGGTFSINPIKSILDVIVSPYMFDQNGVANGLTSAWYILDKSKPWFVLQLRDPGSVIQENPESGQSFERKVQRNRLDIRLNCDFIDPRFVWQGSNGSA